MRPGGDIEAAHGPAARALPERIGYVALATLGGVLLMAMMGLTVCDVIGRYLFDSPVTGAAELTELLLCTTIFLGLPAVSLADAHVTVDLVTDKFPAAWQPVRRVLTGVFSAGVLAVVTWRIWVYADQIAGYGGATNSLMIPLAPIGRFCAVCAGAGALISLAVPVAAFLRGKSS